MDLGLILGTALKEFGTPIGHIVEVEKQVACPGGTPAAPQLCAFATLDSIMAHFAEEVGARIEPADSPLPPCQPSNNMGVRLSVAIQDQRDGSIGVSISQRCVKGSVDTLGGYFLHSKLYPFRYVDGAWRRVGALISIIT